MKPAVEILIVFLLIVVAGICAQDTKPEIPIDFPPDDWYQTDSETESPSALTTEPSTILPTEPSSSTATEPTTTSTTESTTTSTTEPTTTSTTDSTTTTTTESTTTTSTESTTSSTAENTTPSSTQPIPTPTFTPPVMRPTTSRRPTYSTKNPWMWNDLVEKCYLKNEYEYRMVCYGEGWRMTTICYRCCYYENSGFAGCSKLHQGRCSWYDYRRW
ncbi:integumentary mucin C.1 isoform X2 [Drosophila rhopaloa]|uniref:Integumentary mucin C.1-like isoform X2 n=1 Tax=Drosophila rhopaloa TaxID=1041015 RepID=A0A6P4ES44_DRORH|nr:integumentary mucin C.1 isoform X2 [Drosophila rhopaloa]